MADVMPDRGIATQRLYRLYRWIQPKNDMFCIIDF